MILKQNDVSTEGLVNRVFQNGQTVNVGDMGNLLQQYALGTALSNSVTETSVFTLTALAPQIVGNSGSILGRIALTYGTTAILNTTIKAAPAAVTVDTTQSYTLDVLFTWGTANASNTIQTAMAYLEVE